MDVNKLAGENSEGNRNMLLEPGKGDHIVAENSAELCSAAKWKIECVSNETEYLAEEISKQSVEVVAMFF